MAASTSLFARLAARPGWALVALAAMLVALALIRSPDHDESQYVAAAALTAHGLIPYRDFAYLQSPLQPYAFAPLAWLFGTWTWPGLRVGNALLGAAAVLGVYRAGRAAGAPASVALGSAMLFACCDALLFGVGTARNDALPVALLALALAPAIRTALRAGMRSDALLVGLMLSAAAAAKISYALPALGYGLWTLASPRVRRSGWVLAGAIPAALLIAGSWLAAPQGFVFGVFDFPLRAPAEFYADRPARLTVGAKLFDTLRFLALGPALLAVGIAAWQRQRGPVAVLLGILVAAGTVAAVLPTPIWRQYWLPALPPLFVLLATGWQQRPAGRTLRILAVACAVAGLAPSVKALIGGDRFATAFASADRVRAPLAAAAAGPVVTLAPQYLPQLGRLPDPRFAAGPFYFRSRALLNDRDERALILVRQGAIPPLGGRPVLVGGEGGWGSGSAELDDALAAAARRQGYRGQRIAGTPFTLYLQPGVAVRPAQTPRSGLHGGAALGLR
ncbi:MAG: DUF2029 domain-containing protein [Pseudomonadota bacterium]